MFIDIMHAVAAGFIIGLVKHVIQQNAAQKATEAHVESLFRELTEQDQRIDRLESIEMAAPKPERQNDSHG